VLVPCVGPLCGSPVRVPCVGPLCVGPLCGSLVALRHVASTHVMPPARSHAPAYDLLFIFWNIASTQDEFVLFDK